jgi:hypothetical protein
MQCKDAKNPDTLDVKVDLPKAAVWKLFGTMLSDLDVCALDTDLHAAIRSRDVEKLLARTSRYDARSIIERLGSHVSNVSTFGKLYQVGALIKKFPFIGQDTYTPALRKFFKCEDQCRLYNTQNYRALMKLSTSHPKYYGLLNDLRKEIHDLIGDAPDLSQVYANGKHGPGQTAGGQFKGGRVTSFFKYTTLPYTVTESAKPHAIACIESDPRWIGGLIDLYRIQNDIRQWETIRMDEFWDFVLKVVDESEITSVPKTALTDRFIAMEATMNVYLQLGVDHVIRGMLREWGYDLNSQELNQLLAREGSITDSLATLDLAGASDTISLMIVYLLFPPEWISLLLDLRMAQGRTKKFGIQVKFHKLSSMGNGFTFVIESLIFAACTRVAMRRSGVQGKSAVYGDDIICPSGAAPLLIEILQLCGFELNLDKSFISGPFRESCGKDFYLGHDVRPLFITDEFSDVPSLFHLYNSFLLQERKWEWPWGHTFERTKKLLLTWIPPQFRGQCRGPISESTDTHLFTDEPLQRDKRKYRYFTKLVERPSPVKIAYRWKYNTFHLRKLMVPLTPSQELTWWDELTLQRPFAKWDWRKKFDRGNAFDVWRRDHTFYKFVRTYVP